MKDDDLDNESLDVGVFDVVGSPVVVRESETVRLRDSLTCNDKELLAVGWADAETEFEREIVAEKLRVSGSLNDEVCEGVRLAESDIVGLPEKLQEDDDSIETEKLMVLSFVKEFVSERSRVELVLKDSLLDGVKLGLSDNVLVSVGSEDFDLLDESSSVSLADFSTLSDSLIVSLVELDIEGDVVPLLGDRLAVGSLLKDSEFDIISVSDTELVSSVDTVPLFSPDRDNETERVCESVKESESVLESDRSGVWLMDNDEESD